MARPTTLLNMACSLAALALLCACASTPLEQAQIDEQRRSEAVSTAARARKAQDAGQTDQAIELYVKAVQLAPDIPGFRTNMGVALMSKGDRVNAGDAFKSEVQLFPTACQQALTNLGVLYVEAGQDNTAFDYFKRATELSPYEPVALRGVITTGFLQASPDYDQLKIYLQRALFVEKDPKLRDEYKWKQIRAEEAKHERDYNAQHRAPVTRERYEPKRGAETAPANPPAPSHENTGVAPPTPDAPVSPK